MFTLTIRVRGFETDAKVFGDRLRQPESLFFAKLAEENVGISGFFFAFIV